MDVVISALASEVVSRFISFLFHKYSSRACLKKNLETLQHLLLRAHTIVDEAEGRYISNSRMLVQLKILTEAMFRGYHVLDTYAPLMKMGELEEASSIWPFAAVTCSRRRRTANLTTVSCQVQSAVETLETTVANMTEFIMLLITGCGRMPRSPYSSYLYIDNFMFGRQVEKQQAISILMQDNAFRSAPTVLPIVGGCRVGKKTLVGSICGDDRIRCYYPSILHFSGDDEIEKIDHESRFSHVRTLVAIEFFSDVCDEDWKRFYSSLVALTGD